MRHLVPFRRSQLLQALRIVAPTLLYPRAHHPSSLSGTQSNCSRCAHTQYGRRLSSVPTYVSRHFKLNEGDVERFLTRHGLQYRCVREHAVVRLCPFCPPINDKLDNMYKLYIIRSCGVFMCHRCKSKGSWFDLKQQLSFADSQIMHMNRSTEPKVSLQNHAHSHEASIDVQPSQTRYEATLWTNEAQTGDGKVKQYLNRERALSDDVLKTYGVGATNVSFFDGDSWRSHMCITFPMYGEHGKVVRHKIRSVQDKGSMRMEPKGANWGLFGLQTVPKSAEELVITEGELDAMSVYQATGRATVSVPNGASSLPIQVLPLLERFQRIYLWMDEDDAGQNGAKQFSRKLGLQRCLVVRGANKNDARIKDANDCLRNGMEMEALLKAATPVEHEGVMRFNDLRQEVFAEMIGEGSARGAVKCLSLPRLNALLKGHRLGEVTIFSGHTGVGKTTLLGQMSLDYCLQGVGTLWGSFEVPNVRLAQKLLRQFHAIHGDRSDLVQSFDYWADRFSELPMYFMKYHGSNPAHRIVDVMEYANYVLDCRHMVLDNLQFMTYNSGMNERGRFEVMDDALGQIRQFASGCGAHVTLVVHPRKTDDENRIQIASVYGSAKATQEADNVLVLQRTEHGKELEVLKNRFDGAVGSIRLRFDANKLLYAEVDSSGDWVIPALSERRRRVVAVGDFVRRNAGRAQEDEDEKLKRREKSQRARGGVASLFDH